MTPTIPNLITLLRLALIPLLVLAYWLPWTWSNVVAMAIFVLAGVSDWLDGFLARQLGQQSAFGAFLDPVADKLMVATALVLLVADPGVRASVLSPTLFTLVAVVIIGREIAVSALREWMAELGKRASVAVSLVGKFKTFVQFIAIPMMLYKIPIGGISMARAGELLLYLAGGLTVWSMLVYLRAAWPSLTEVAGKAGENAGEQKTGPDGNLTG